MEKCTDWLVEHDYLIKFRYISKYSDYFRIMVFNYVFVPNKAIERTPKKSIEHCRCSLVHQEQRPLSGKVPIRHVNIEAFQVPDNTG